MGQWLNAQRWRARRSGGSREARPRASGTSCSAGRYRELPVTFGCRASKAPIEISARPLGRAARPRRDRSRPLVRPRASATGRTASGSSTSTGGSARGGCRRSPAPPGLVTDRFMRTLGLRRVAEREAAGARAGHPRPRWTRYCAGVNAAAADRPLPVEFQLLRQRFEAVRAGRRAHDDEAPLLRPVHQLGAGAAARRDDPRARPRARRSAGSGVSAGNPVVLTPGAGWSGDGLALAEQIAKVRGTIGLAVEATGSNNWAVSGERSATGGPLMAGDPHLPPSMPGITYQVGLYLGDRFCRGASLPGLPGVTMGQNNDVAWTFTNVMADVMDLFIERIDGDEYEFEGERRPLEVDRGGDRRQGPGVEPERLVGPRDRARADRQRGSARRRRGAARAALLGPRLAGDHRGELRRPRLRRRPRAGRGACGSRSSRVEPGLGGSPRFDRLQDGRPDPAAKGRLPRSAEARLDGRVRVGGLDPLRGAAADSTTRRRDSSSRPTTVSLRRITRTTSRATTWTATGRNGSRSCFRRAPSTIWRASSRCRRTCSPSPASRRCTAWSG